MKQAYLFNTAFERTDSFSDAEYLYVQDALVAERLRKFCEMHECDKPYLGGIAGTFYWNEDKNKWESLGYKINLYVTTRDEILKSAKELDEMLQMR